MTEDNLQRIKLEEVRIIIREIKSTNPFPVFEWIGKQDNEFDYSDLLFKLHKLVNPKILTFMIKT